MRYYIGIDSGKVAGIAVLDIPEGYEKNATLLYAEQYSSNGSLVERMHPDNVKKAIPGQIKPEIAIECLEFRNGQPESVRVIKGVARMQGVDIQTLQAEFAPLHLRYHAISSKVVTDALTLNANATKRERQDAVLKFIDVPRELERLVKSSEHVRDAILFAWCARMKSKE